MFTIIHVAFELFKIVSLAAAYTFALYILKFLYTEIKRDNRVKEVKFLSVYVPVVGLMLIYSFTYYGDHGLGDEAHLPIGYGETIDESDNYSYFDSEKEARQINVDSFLVRHDHLCIASDTLIYDCQLKSGEVKKFTDEKIYDAYASGHHLPKLKEFKKFSPQYAAYWNGWRFWCLP